MRFTMVPVQFGCEWCSQLPVPRLRRRFAKDYSTVMEQWSYPSFCALLSSIGVAVLAGEATTRAGDAPPPSITRSPLVLDVGCGPGGHTLALARMFPSLRVLGVDLAPEMVEIAIGRATSLDLPPRNLAFGVISADSVEAASTGLVSCCDFRAIVPDTHHVVRKDDVADAAIANLVLMIVPDTLAALAAVAASVKAGAPVAMSVWGSPGRSPLFTLLNAAIHEAGLVEAAGPGFAAPQGLRSNFHLGVDAEATAKVMESAGFECVTLSSMDLPMPGGPVLGASEGAARLMGLTPGNTKLVEAIRSAAGEEGVSRLSAALTTMVQRLMDAHKPLALNVVIISARRSAMR